MENQELRTYEVDMIAHVRLTTGGANPTDAIIKARQMLTRLLKDGSMREGDFIVHKVRLT